MKTVRIYTKSTCGYCHMAKRLLDNENIPFEEIDVTFDSEKHQEMIELSGRYTVPQVFIGEQAIGGFTELAGLQAGNQLNKMLESDC